MHRIVQGLLLASLLLAGLSYLAAQEKSAPLVIKGGTLIDGTGGQPIENATILVEGGKISAVGGKVKVPPDAKVIVATGKFIIPGLIDSRVRIGPTPGNHVSRNEVSIDQRLESFRALLGAGVSTARLIQGDFTEQKLYQRWWKEDLLVSGGIVAAGPVFTARGGRPIEEYSALAWEVRDREIRQIADEDDARAKARELTHAELNSMEIEYDQGPRTDARPRLAKSLLEVLVAEGHGFDLPVFCEAGSDQEAADAVSAGANAIEGAWEELLSDATLAAMAKKQTFFVPLLVQQGDLLNLLDAPALKAYLEEPIVQRSLSSVMKESLANGSGLIEQVRKNLNSDIGQVVRGQLERQQKRAVENVRHAQAAGVKIAVGTGSASLLVFPGAAVHRELQLLVKAGLTPMEAIVAATRNTAMALGRSDELGTIEAGKKADIVILDADPLVDIQNTEKIHEVIQNGREVPDQVLLLH